MSILLSAIFKKGKYILWLISFSTFFPGVIYAQDQDLANKEIQLPKGKLKVNEVIEILKKETKVSFYYNNDHIQPERIIHFDANKSTLSEILNLITADTELEFIIEQNYIVIRLQRKSLENVKTDEIEISGYVIDKISGEKLPGTTVKVTGTGQGVISDENGYFSLKLNKGKTSDLSFSFVGYKEHSKHLLHDTDQVINISLESDSQLEEVEIISNYDLPLYKAANQKSARLSANQLESLPTIGGEVEVLKVIQFYPGVLSNIGGTGGLNVRGSTDGQNLILLDGMPVYGVSHVAGILSPFNAGAIQNINVYKGGAGVQYQGHLSSTIDIDVKEGNREKLKGKAGLGIITTNFNLEGPIGKKSSFMLSARRSYIDFLIKPIAKRLDTDFLFNFYDIHGKLTHWISDKDKISFNLYFGRDKFRTKIQNDVIDIFFRNETREFKLNNISLGLHWSKVYNENTFSNLWLSYRRQIFDGNTKFEHTREDNNPGQILTSDTENTTGIRDLSLKWELEKEISSQHNIKSGIETILHIFSPVDYTYSINSQLYDVINFENINTVETSYYIKDEFKVNDKLQINTGVRFTSYLNDKKLYLAIQPRITSRLLLSPNASLKFLYSYSQQFLQPALFRATTVPIYNWLPSSEGIRPGKVHQFSLGWFQKLGENFEASAETYFKSMHHLITYNNTYGRLLQLSDWRENIVTGNGRSYGLELYIRKKNGKLNGWIGYTLSKAERKFDHINRGKWFPFLYDRRHNFSITLFKSWSKRSYRKTLFSMSWIYGSGLPYSSPSIKYQIANDANQHYYNEILGYGERNSLRLKPEHRMDLSFTFLKNKKRGDRKWILGMYNLYNRKNPFTYSGTFNEGNYFIKASTYLTILPTITYEFRF